MKRYYFFSIIIFILTSLAYTKPMNVILIMADDLGYECLSSYGGESYKTPHLDRLSAGGMTFLNAHSQPICTPSRVQIMTGKYNVKNYKKFAYLDPNEKTFAHYFKDAGYKTCMVGKWQLAGGIDAPYHFGFDEYSLWRIMKNDNQSRYPNPGIVENGEFKNYQNGEYGPDRMNQFALKFIEDNKDKAFMLYYSMLLVHNPFEPTPDSEDWDPEAIGLDNLKGGFKGKDNAKYFSEKGAAVCVEEMEIDAQKLAREVFAIISNTDKIKSMSEASSSLAKPEAADLLADEVIKIMEIIE